MVRGLEGVQTSKNYISATSYHSRQQFASVERSILWEYVEGDSGHWILVVDFGGNDRAVHVREAIVASMWVRNQV
jgi:hypothetical protein